MNTKVGGNNNKGWLGYANGTVEIKNIGRSEVDVSEVQIDSTDTKEISCLLTGGIGSGKLHKRVRVSRPSLKKQDKNIIKQKMGQPKIQQGQDVDDRTGNDRADKLSVGGEVLDLTQELDGDRQFGDSQRAKDLREDTFVTTEGNDLNEQETGLLQELESDLGMGNVGEEMDDKGSRDNGGDRDNMENMGNEGKLDDGRDGKNMKSNKGSRDGTASFGNDSGGSLERMGMRPDNGTGNSLDNKRGGLKEDKGRVIDLEEYKKLKESLDKLQGSLDKQKGILATLEAQSRQLDVTMEILGDKKVDSLQSELKETREKIAKMEQERDEIQVQIDGLRREEERGEVEGQKKENINKGEVLPRLSGQRTEQSFTADIKKIILKMSSVEEMEAGYIAKRVVEDFFNKAGKEFPERESTKKFAEAFRKFNRTVGSEFVVVFDEKNGFVLQIPEVESQLEQRSNAVDDYLAKAA